MNDQKTRDEAKTAPIRIGVFDSGFGGLTVLRALLRQIPGAEFFYLGDTARLPYGSKSQTTVARYAVESALLLETYGAEYLVIACNTASALALDAIRSAAHVPVLGVIETGADSAAAASVSGDVLVLATQATVESHAYAHACAAHGLRSMEKACPLLVPLIEEGWIESPVTREVLRIYLEEALAVASEAGLLPDTVLLGCTHYPLLRALLEEALPKGMTILDSAETTAHRVRRELSALPAAHAKEYDADLGRCHFFATDSVDKFRTLGSRFLGQPIERVELIDLGG
ncbi:MAG TPA: glutamate racemase [Acidobacteriaceae bacterium]|nr:glutamate racemase [Acidobacteriaceae bacterium]